MFTIQQRCASRIFYPMRTVGVLVVILVCLVGTMPAAGTAATPFSKRAGNFRLSPDGQRVVYTYLPENGPRRLVSALLPNGPAQDLVDEQTLGGEIRDFIISPDSSTVVFEVYHSADFLTLHSIPMSGGTLVTLTPDGTQSVGIRFKISADNRYIVFSGEDAAQTCALYTASLQGGNIRKLTSVLCISDAFDLTPDGSRIVYFDSDGTFKTMQVEGGDSVKIDTSSPQYTYYIISADSSHIVYEAGSGNESPRLYSAALASGTSTMLDSVFPLSCHYDFFFLRHFCDKFAVDPISQRVVFPVTTNDEYALYSVPIAGGAADVLATSSCPFQRVTISPDGTQVVYQTCLAANNTTYRLHSVPLAGGTPVELNAELAYDRYHRYCLDISPDSHYILYSAYSETDSDDWSVGIFDLYSIPIGGGPSTFISPHVSVNASRMFTKDGKHVIFNTAPFGLDLSAMLYRSNVSNGQGSVIASHSSISGFSVTPDERYIVYTADYVDAQGSSLYVMPVADNQLFLPFVLASDLH